MEEKEEKTERENPLLALPEKEIERKKTGENLKIRQPTYEWCWKYKVRARRSDRQVL